MLDSDVADRRGRHTGVLDRTLRRWFADQDFPGGLSRGRNPVLGESLTAFALPVPSPWRRYRRSRPMVLLRP